MKTCPIHCFNPAQRLYPAPQGVRSPKIAGICLSLSLLYLAAACQPSHQSASNAPAFPNPPAQNPPDKTTAKLALPTVPEVPGQLKIGTLLPLTGDLAQYGQPMQQTANLLVETVNACGGVLKKPVKLIAEDDQTDPSAGAAGMTKLAEVDQVAGVVGAAGSAVSSAAVDIAVRNNVVQISPSSTSPSFSDRAAKGDFQGFWFRTAPPDNFQGEALARVAKQQGWKTVAILAINNDYGSGLSQSFTMAFKQQGGTVAHAARYAATAATFDSELQAVFQGTPDAVMLVAYPETGSLILKAAQEQGLLGSKTKLLLTDGMKTDRLADLVGKTPDGKFVAAGVIGTAASSGGPAIAPFKQRYTKQFNREPAVYDPNTWDASALLVLAAEAAQSNRGIAMRDKIREVANGPGQSVTDVCQALSLLRQGKSINYQGASGTIDFNSLGDVIGKYDVWAIDQNGKLHIQSTLDIGGVFRPTQLKALGGGRINWLQPLL